MQKERQVARSGEIGEGRFKKGFSVFVGFFPPKGFNHPSSSPVFSIAFSLVLPLLPPREAQKRRAEERGIIEGKKVLRKSRNEGEKEK